MSIQHLEHFHVKQTRGFSRFGSKNLFQTLIWLLVVWLKIHNHTNFDLTTQALVHLLTSIGKECSAIRGKEIEWCMHNCASRRPGSSPKWSERIHTRPLRGYREGFAREWTAVCDISTEEPLWGKTSDGKPVKVKPEMNVYKKQAGNGPSRRHIYGSKIAKGLQSVKYALLQ